MGRVDWDLTYQQSAPKLIGICRRYVKERAIAEDIVQESFIVAMQKEDSLKNIKALNGWLSRIVVNMALHHIKKAKETVFSINDQFDTVDKTSLMSNLTLDNKSQLLASGIEVKDILAAMDRLPEHHRAVFNMYIMDGFSHKEIAETLDISVGTSKSHLSRARKSVQGYLVEHLDNKKVSENKKRAMAFLIFLGFGDSLFAANCKKAFSSFEIEPLNPSLDLNKKINTPNTFVGLQRSNSMVTGLAIGSIVALVLTGAWLYQQQNIEDITTSPVVIEKTIEDNLEVKEAEAIIDSVVSSPISLPENVENIEKKPILEVEKTNPVKEKEIETSPVITSTQVAESSEQETDSLKTKKAKVVVIKKQVIARDTVYVTK